MQTMGNEDLSEKEVDSDEELLQQVIKENPELAVRSKSEHKRMKTKTNAAIVTIKDFDSPKSAKRPISSPSIYSPAIDVNTPSETYKDRKKPGDVIFRYKCNDSSPWEEGDRRRDGSWNIQIISPTADFIRDNFKFMFQSIQVTAGTLDAMVQESGTEVLKALREEENTDNLEAIASSLQEMSTEEAYFVGRIRSEGRLSEESVSFEGTAEDSNGHIINLDMSELEEYTVFPGQTAVIAGRNEMGKCLRVSKMHVPKPLPFKTVDTSKHDFLNILIAAGPFTPSDSLNYEPMKDLISVITKIEPDICILLGPFLDASHQMLESGEIGMTFDELFQKQFRYFEEKIADCSTKVIVVSSYKDATGQLVYPTPQLSSNKLCQNQAYKFSEKFMFLPDPATVSVGGIIIGMTSTDVLMHLSRNELSSKASSVLSGDRMSRLARHLLQQRSFYPLYPSDESVPFDVGHYVHFGKMESRPHILILPSDLRHFIKNVDGTIVVNPEKLTKGIGGTYARLQVEVSALNELDSVADYCAGEIVKI